MTIAAATCELERHSESEAAPATVLGARGVIRSALDAPERLGRDWADLATQAAEPNAFAEAWFAAAGLQHLAAGQDVKMLEVWSGARGDGLLLGLMPLCMAKHYGRIPVRNVQNWMHFHNFLGTPLIRAGYEQTFWTAALAALDADPWARGFLHIESLTEGGAAHSGLAAAAKALGRPCDVVHRTERALLASDLSPQDYYEQTVRKKKRKELKRLASRLAEQGAVEVRRLADGDELPDWCDAFLTLEQAGWKGEAGSALGCSPATEAFFRDAMHGAFAAGKLDMLRLDLDGRPIAMLVNLLAPPGSFSFKIAYDEGHARFSPGVLIQLENLRILGRADIGWMDSCAVENHPMINSLWAERRALVRVSVPLAGLRRGAAFRLCRWAEKGGAALRRVRSRPEAAQRKADEDE